jgi:hypothetical protein
MTCVRERYATSWVSALQNRSTLAQKCLVICPKYVGRVWIPQVIPFRTVSTTFLPGSCKVHFKPSAEALIISIQARFQLVSLFYYSAPHLPYGVYQYCFCVISCVKPTNNFKSIVWWRTLQVATHLQGLLPWGMLPKSRITSAGFLTGAMMENQGGNGRYGYILMVHDRLIAELESGVIRTGKCFRRSTKVCTVYHLLSLRQLTRFFHAYL